MTDFASFKKESKGNFDKLTDKLKSMDQAKSYEDDRYWRPTTDANGNGTATIRFLQAKTKDDDCFVELHSHSFQGKGGWYIENCPTTHGGQCPLCQANNELWNSGVESDKEIARKRKRKLHYISNILVINDPKNPDNNGKVFLYKYGKKIFDKLKASAQPEFEDQQAIDPFNFWVGRNFKLRVRKVEGYPNYDSSELDVSSALFDGNDKQIEVVWKQLYNLKAEVDATKFKNYDALRARLDLVLNGSTKDIKSVKQDRVSVSENNMSKILDTVDGSAPFAVNDSEGLDSGLNYFKNLAEED